MKGSKPGEPPGTGQLVGVHPAPERPGTSVNHKTTPKTVATAGSPAQIVTPAHKARFPASFVEIPFSTRTAS